MVSFFSQPRLCWSGGKQVLCWSECFCKSSVKGMTYFNAKITLFTKKTLGPAARALYKVQFLLSCLARSTLRLCHIVWHFFLETQDFVRRQSFAKLLLQHLGMLTLIPFLFMFLIIVVGWSLPWRYWLWSLRGNEIQSFITWKGKKRGSYWWSKKSPKVSLL